MLEGIENAGKVQRSVLERTSDLNVHSKISKVLVPENISEVLVLEIFRKLVPSSSFKVLIR